MEDGGADAVGGGVAVGIRLNRYTDIQAGSVVLQVRAKIVGVHGVADVGGNHEAVRVGLADNVGAVSRPREAFADALDGAGEKVSASAMAEQRSDFFVVEEAYDFYDSAVVACGVHGIGGGFRIAG